jgi:PAS domain S-box-containing protein
MVNKYFLILNECLTSLGNSLILKDMLKEFLRTVTKKTSAISAVALDKTDLSEIVKINKKGIDYDPENFLCDHKEQHLHIIDKDSDEKLVILYFDSIIIFLKYRSEIEELDKLANMLFSLDKKVNSSVEACRAFEEHKRVKETLELAISGANDGLWDWDVESNEVYFSPRWKSMIGYEEDEIQGDFYEWESRIHPDDKEKALDNVKKYINGETEHFENVHRLKHKDGSWVWILDRGKALFEDGKIKKFVGFHTDITKQKKLEEELESRVKDEVAKNQKKDLMLQQQSRLAQLGEMISMIAHQWRQPLASIASVALTLKLRISLGKFDLSTKEKADLFLDNLGEDMDDIEDLVQHLTKTIDDFRDFYKPNKKPKTETINLPIEKSLSIVETQFTQQNIDIDMILNSKTQLKLFDSELIQVFLNILKNALDNFMEKDIQTRKLIIRSCDLEDGKVEVTILDNGGGIPAEILPKVFDPYFSTKNEKNGTGLGLYMSKLIIEQHHNGHLEASNKGDGVEFKITL